MLEKRLGRLGAIGASALLVAAGVGASAPSSEASVIRRFEGCTDTTRYVPTINQGETVSLIARAAVGEGDWKVDGVKQYDNSAETQSLLGFKSADSNAKSWTITADYTGTLLILKCGATDADFNKWFGKIGFNLDKNNGLNSPVSTTNMQALVK